jgi:hypothetical protein
VNGTSSGPNATEKAEREKAKKKEKKERKDKERAERVERDKGEKDGTPRSASTPVLPEPASQDSPNAQRADEVKSPVTTDGGGSTGVRTPKTGRPPRNPWTIFMRMQVAVTEPELRDFFGEAKSGVCRVSLSHWN